MNKVKALTIVAGLMLAAAAVTAQTYVSPVNIGTTNVWYSNAVTTVTTAGGAAGVDVQRNADVGIEVRFQPEIATINNTIVLRFARSVDGTYWETTNWLSHGIAIGSLAAGYTNVIYTNFPSAAVGACSKIRLERIEMPAYCSVTGAVVRVIKKQPRSN